LRWLKLRRRVQRSKVQFQPSALSKEAKMAKSIPPPPTATNFRDKGKAGEEQKKASIQQMLAQVAGQGGSSFSQPADTIMQGADILMQAAQSDPRLVPFVRQAIQILQEGVKSLAMPTSGEGEIGQPSTQPKPRSKGRVFDEEEGGAYGSPSESPY
jgi:hypothetical protein